MGRHKVVRVERNTHRSRSRAVISVVAVAALVLGAGVAGAAISRGAFDPLFAGDGGCSNPSALSVVADPTIAPAIESVAADFDSRAEACHITTVRAQDSADTAAVIASGGDTKADIWLPDSSIWIERMAATALALGRTAPDLDPGTPLASTPVVFAAPASRAAAFSAEPVGWTSILAGKISALLPDPESSSTSLAALLALRGQSSTGDPRQFAGVMIELGRTIPESIDAAFDSALTADRPTVVITSEQSVVAYNAKDPAEPLVALYPVEGTTAVEFPAIRLAPPTASGDSATGETDAAAASTSSSSKTPTQSDLLDSFMNAVLSSSTLADQGFRDGDGTGEIDAAGVIATHTSAVPAADAPSQIEILRSWGVLNLRSRMLAVIDVSGSMLEPASGGLRRIDVFQQAAGGALAKFSGEVELGVWIFSTTRLEQQDWEDLSPIAPLGDAAHSQQIAEIVASLPARISGNTGLYDTTLAAVQRVRESYQPDKINSVLLITDGKNDDTNGIDLDSLITELERTDDPLKPVPVIMIGFGPDTDLASMTRIARTTGGAAYTAAKPEDLPLVLVDALSQRVCRPDC